jgi:prepilin-type processing-associated H-X9-DG protein
MAILSALLFPVFTQSREKARSMACLSNMRQIGTATTLYTTDYDERYPQSKVSDATPDVGDASGAEENPDNGSNFAKILPYTGAGASTAETSMFAQKLFACPDDPAPFNPDCPSTFNVGGPHVISYLYNAYFAFGITEAGLASPANTILVAERRSSASKNAADSFCDDIYHPWFNPTTNAANVPSAMPNEMDASPNTASGAIATRRHNGGANYIFADGHARWELFERTFDPANNVNLHRP